MAKFDLKQNYLILDLGQDINIHKSFDLSCSTLGNDINDKKTRLARLFKKNIEEIDITDLFKLNLLVDPEVSVIEIPINNKKRDLFQLEDLVLNFHYLIWHHDSDNLIIAYIPDLEFFAISKKSSDWKEKLKLEILADIKRKKLTLFELSKVRLINKITIGDINVPVEIPTMLEDLENDFENKEDEKVLRKVATRIAAREKDTKYLLEPYLKLMADYLLGEDLQSILLCGPSGCGKSSAVMELARRRYDFNLGQWNLWETSGARIVAGMSGFGMWQERCEKLIKETEGKKVIFHMGSLLELMDVGKSVSNTEGIASWFKPMMSRGKIIIIVECTPEQLSLIEKEDPYLLNVLNVIEIDKFNDESILTILHSIKDDKYPEFEIEKKAFDVIIELHNRFAPYSAYPARPIRFLENLFLKFQEEGKVTVKDVYQEFSYETGIPSFIIDDNEALIKTDALNFFQSNVLGQELAIAEIYKLITVIKSNMDRPSKPIGSFLFIGPTGTGKTETAKTLAQYLFGHQRKLIRFDMSEYSSFDSIDRLVGKGFGSEGLLVSKVREEPFSVILFDEFEKASPRFFDLLLQILDAGRLTDSKGRIADFCSTVIIMTSNLGAVSFSKSNFGFKENDSKSSAINHFKGEVQKFLRPEIYNRIDKIVPFVPLEKETIKSICNRELNLVKKRDGILFRNIELNFSNELIEFISDKGFDILFGARPIKRAITDEVLSKLSDGINQYQIDSALSIDISLNDKGPYVYIRSKASTDKLNDKKESANKKYVDKASELRRLFDKINHCPQSLKLRNKIGELESLNYNLERKMKKKKWVDPVLFDKLESLKEYKKINEGKKELENKVMGLEKEVLLTFYKDKDLNEELKEKVQIYQNEIENILIQLYSMEYQSKNKILLCFYSKSINTLLELLEYYKKLIHSMGFHYEVFALELITDKNDTVEEEIKTEDEPDDLTEENEKKEEKIKFVLNEIKESPIQVDSNVKTMILKINGDLARLIFEHESGVHNFKSENKEVFIERSFVDIDKYKPNQRLLKKMDFTPFDLRRIYNRDKQIVEDKRLNKRYQWGNKKLDLILNKIIMDNFNFSAYSILEQ